MVHMGWTNPRLLASGAEWFSAVLDNGGPACYEIGTGGPRGGGISWHYVGETASEKNRMARYGSDGSHISELINEQIDEGKHIWYRAQYCRTKQAAKKMQDNLLKRFRYDWNKASNG